MKPRLGDSNPALRRRDSSAGCHPAEETRVREGWKMTMRRFALGALAVAWAALDPTHAMTLTADGGNIVELLQQSNDIVVGRVGSVTDGLDERGIPYTEVTLTIAETIRGSRSGEYKFRQFGLLKPRPTADGKRKMMTAPPGFPKYAKGEDVVLFLRPAAAWTGFRMPAGVTRGKFVLGPGRVENDMANVGLFSNLDVDRGLVTEPDKRLLTNASGPLNPEAFLSFVRRAVQDRWIETGRMTRTHKPGARTLPPPSDPEDANPQPPAPTTPAPQTAPLDPKTDATFPRTGR